MRITILTMGTRGDTQPFISLANRLKEEGHDVILGARPDFAELAAQYGITFAALGNPYKTFIKDNTKNFESGNFFKIALQGVQKRKQIFENMGEDAYRAAQGSDLIIYKYSWVAGYTIAKKLGIPHAAVMLYPMTPTREFPCYLIGRGKERGAIGNAMCWWISEQLIMWQYQRGPDNKLRRELGLRSAPFFGHVKQQGRESMPIYCAYSPLLQPKPADWPERIHITGIWKSPAPENWSPPDDLTAFLENGDKPVYIGFGSMPSSAGRTLKIILKALEISGKRGVLLSGWAGLGEKEKLPGSVFCVKDIPHSWLFPKMAAAVHHGGAGTTAAGLLGGVPSVISPSTIDQHSWGRQVYKLGASPQPIPFSVLTPENLAAAITSATSDEKMKLRAAEIGRALRNEDGIGYVVGSILAQNPHVKPDAPALKREAYK